MNLVDQKVRESLRLAVPDDEPAPDTALLAKELINRRRERHRRMVVVRSLIACVALGVGGLAAYAVTSGDEPDPVVVTDAEESNDASAWGEPGWHVLDPGPVPASARASLAWTGEELIVAAGLQVFSYGPETQEWRSLPDLPFAPETQPSLLWTDHELVAVAPDPRASVWAVGQDPERDELERSGHTAVLGPDDEQWRTIPGPELAPQMAALGVNGPRNPGYELGLIWTGERVIDTTHGAALDLTTEEWAPLPAPDDLVSFTALLSTNPVWDGERVLLQSLAPSSPGLAWDPLGEGFQETAPPPDELVPTNIVENALPVSDGNGTITFLVGRDQTNVLRLHTRTGEWETLPDLDVLISMNDCATNAALVGDRLITRSCDLGSPNRDLYVLEQDRWVNIGSPPATGLVASWQSTDGALVLWATSTDTINGPPQPERHFQVWVPPGD